MQCPGFSDETYAFHALDLLQGSERDEIERHLQAGCGTCAAQIERSRTLWYAVGSATVQAAPPKRLRASILKTVTPERAVWWRAWPVLATAALILVSFTAGLFTARVYSPSRNFVAFSPVYPSPAPESRRPAAALENAKPAVKEIVRQAPDPTLAETIASLNADLLREIQKSQQLEAEVTRQKSLAAAARDSATDADRRFAAASAGNRETEELRRQMTALTGRAGELERQVAQYKALVEAQRRRLDQTTQIAGMISDPSLRIVQLRGTEKDRSIEAHAAIAAGNRMVFYASHLPALPANRTYQLWLVRSSGAPVSSAGTFTRDSFGKAVLELQDAALLSAVTALAVTDEPAGGSKSPTGHKWLIGS
jgi:anti-sigma-K factor RskA